MITSKQILKVCELWVKSIKVWKDEISIYENPGSSDFIKMYKTSKSRDYRYIADANHQNVFVWDANGALHSNVQSKMNLFSSNRQEPNLYLGYCKLDWGRMVSDNVGDYCYTSPKLKWNWLEKYIKGSSSLIEKQANK